MISSLANSPGTSPVINTLFSVSRKDSALISLSVNKNVVPLPAPAFLYRVLMSSSSDAWLYVFVR